METINILLITREVDFAEDIERRIRLETNIHLTAENSCATGFDFLTNNPVDFLITEASLIDADIFQLLSSVTQRFGSMVKKIVLLDNNDPILSANLITSGADYTLTKPVSGESLIAMINQINVAAKYPKFGMNHTVGQAEQQTQNAQAFTQAPGGFPPPRSNPNDYQQPDNFYQARQSFSINNENTQRPMNNQSPYSDDDSGFRYRNNNVPQGGSVPNPSGNIRTLKQTTIAINCSKGGVGKTTLSKEIALAYSSVRINGEPLKVVLIDCDIQFGDIASIFNIKPYPNIKQWHDDIIAMKKNGYTSEQCKFSQETIESRYLINYPPTGLKILAAPPNTSEAMKFVHQEMRTIIQNIKACDFDVIILDTGNNIDDYTIICLEEAMMLLIVTTVEIPAIDDTIKLVKLLRQSGFSLQKAKLLINKMPAQSDIDIEQISETIGLQIIATIPDYPKLRIINNQGNAAVLSKDTEFSIAIKQLAHQMVPVFNKQVNKNNSGKPASQKNDAGKKKGLFSHLFGGKKGR